MNIIIPDVQDDRAGGDLSETMVSRPEIKDSMVFFFTVCYDLIFYQLEDKTIMHC